MTSSKRKIKLLSVSDVHVGHHRVKGDVILENFRRHVLPLITKDLDILCIVGDFFDTLLDMNGSAGYHAVTIIQQLRSRCIEHGVFLRVLRGTFSHDRNQNQFFHVEEDNPYLHGTQQIRVIDNIAIEHLPHFDINILYVPDDLPYEDAMPVIEDKVREHQLAKVDIALTHSYYEHLVPSNMPHLPHNTYNATRFGKLVRGPILNGHVHTPCVFKTVITNGSFERLCHGEEEAKGFFLVEYDKDSGLVSHEFVENTSATLFKTIDLSRIPRDQHVDVFVSRIKEIIDGNKSCSKNVFVRTVSADATSVQQFIAFTRERYPQVILTNKALGSAVVESTTDISSELTELPTITEANLPDMVIEYFRSSGKTTTLTEREVRAMLA